MSSEITTKTDNKSSKKRKRIKLRLKLKPKNKKILTPIKSKNDIKSKNIKLFDSNYVVKLKTDKSQKLLLNLYNKHEMRLNILLKGLKHQINTETNNNNINDNIPSNDHFISKLGFKHSWNKPKYLLNNTIIAPYICNDNIIKQNLPK